MATYHGNKGLYHEANRLGSGGEGTVYSISGNPNSVLKIYHPAKLTSELRRKVELMLSIRSRFDNRVLSSLAWPTDIVNDDKGNFAGLVMPKVVGDPINECYRANDFSVNYEQRICIAKNLCVAVDAVHSAKQTIGDFNPNNIIVNKKTGAVTLVDTDSFHLKNDRGVLFPCTVGLGTYVAPELQGMNLGASYLKTYTQETDRFSLAIHIFCLLMNGAHPFASRQSPINTRSGKSSVVLPPTESLIKNGQSPHFSRKRSGTLPPPYCPDIKMLPSNIRGLFERAFDSGHQNPAMRPSAEEWYDELSVVQRKTRKCLKDNTHIYPDHVKKCPWCEILGPSSQTTKRAFSPSVKPQSTVTQSNTRPALSSGTSKNNKPTSSAKEFISQRRLLLKEKRKYKLVSMVVYVVLASLCLVVLASLCLFVFSTNVSKDWILTLVFYATSLCDGAAATWFTNSYFIEEWPVKRQRNWGIPLAVTVGLLACIVPGLLACIFPPRIILFILTMTSALPILLLILEMDDYDWEMEDW